MIETNQYSLHWRILTFFCLKIISNLFLGYIYIFFRCWDILFSTCLMFPTREALHNVSSIWPSILIFTLSFWFRNEWTAGYDERVLLWTWCFSKFWNQSFLCPRKLWSWLKSSSAFTGCFRKTTPSFNQRPFLIIDLSKYLLRICVMIYWKNSLVKWMVSIEMMLAMGSIEFKLSKINLRNRYFTWLTSIVHFNWMINEIGCFP